VKPTLLLTHVARALSGPGAPCAGQTVVAGLSGGADSVAMLDALLILAPERGFRVVAAHLDHRLRPTSKEDAAFCAELCRRLGVTLRSASADVAALARRDGGGVEEAGREERYAFLRRVKEQEGAAAIAVAHTRDDQAETLLLRLLRGAGRRGLGAMRERSGGVWRPLLSTSRSEVLEHLRARGLSWREDPTNADPSYLRNRVRAELLPYLESRFNPSARETLARAAAVLAEEDDLLAQMADEQWRVIATLARNEFTLAIKPGGLSGPPRPPTLAPAVVLVREALRRIPRVLARLVLRRALEETGGLKGVGHAHLEKLVALAGGASGRRLPLPGGREAVVRFGEMRIGPRLAARESFAFDLPVPGRVELPDGQVVLARPARGPASAWDRSAVVAAPDGPLVVRTRQVGDRVRAGRREVSLKRFLIDRRVPADLRPWLPLVATGNLVLWVPGQPAPAAAERAGGRGGREVERSETSANPAYPGDAKRTRQMSGGGFIPAPRPGDAKRPRKVSGWGFIPAPRPGDAKRPRKVSGGGFIPAPRTTRRASVAPRILGGAPLAPPSSMTRRYVRLELEGAEAR
jgi:tRNA(Ile)-lysidine synthase